MGFASEEDLTRFVEWPKGFLYSEEEERTQAEVEGPALNQFSKTLVNNLCCVIEPMDAQNVLGRGSLQGWQGYKAVLSLGAILYRCCWENYPQLMKKPSPFQSNPPIPSSTCQDIYSMDTPCD